MLPLQVYQRNFEAPDDFFGEGYFSDELREHSLLKAILLFKDKTFSFGLSFFYDKSTLDLCSTMSIYTIVSLNGPVGHLVNSNRLWSFVFPKA